MQLERFEPGPNDVIFDPEATSRTDSSRTANGVATRVDAYVGDRLSVAETCLLSAAFATLLSSFVLAVAVSA